MYAISVILCARILHEPLGAEDARGKDAGRGFCGAVGGAKGGKDDGGCAAHGAKEALIVLFLFTSNIWVLLPTYGVGRAERRMLATALTGTPRRLTSGPCLQ